MKRDFLNNVNPENIFHLKDGRKLKNLFDFTLHLKNMDDGVYQHHAGDNNHFSNWIKDCVGDKELAEKIKSAKNKQEAFKIALHRVDELFSLKEADMIQDLDKDVITNKPGDVEKDVELLSQGISTENFLKAYSDMVSGNFFQQKSHQENELKESGESSQLFKRPDSFDDIRPKGPLDMSAKDSRKVFYDKITELNDCLSRKDIKRSKSIYNELVKEFENLEIGVEHKRKIHDILLNVYRGIKRL